MAKGNLNKKNFIWAYGSTEVETVCEGDRGTGEVGCDSEPLSRHKNLILVQHGLYVYLF